MIRNEIKYKGEVILTIYHKLNGYKNFKKECSDIKDLVFIQENVPNISDDEIIKKYKYKIKKEGLLPAGANKNPYFDKTCAKMIHYKCDKPKNIFKLLDNSYILNDISIDELNKINNFIEKYTGFKVEKNFTLYGDVFIFEPIVCDYSFNKGYIEFRNIPLESKVLMTLKSGEKVIDHKTKYIEDKNVNVFIGENWTSIDLSIFNGNKLIYIAEFSPIRSFELNINSIHSISYNFKNKKYKNCKVNFDIHCDQQKYDYFSLSMSDYEKIISNTNEYIYKITDSIEKKNEIIFVKKNEIKRNNNFIEYICEFMTKSCCDELWIFDPYFLHDIDIFVDWIKLLSEIDTQKINIVIDVNKLKNKEFKKEEIDNKINSLKILILSNKNSINKDVYVYSTKKNKNIHDRFILKKQNISDGVNTISGLSIGTSFNSLHNNYYCIYELDNNISKDIFYTITNCIDDNELFSINMKIKKDNPINEELKQALYENREKFEISEEDFKDLEKNICRWKYDEINNIYSQRQETELELKNRLRKNEKLGCFLYEKLKDILKNEIFYYQMFDVHSFHESVEFKNIYLLKIIKLLFLIDSVKFRELALKEDKYNFIINNLIYNLKIYFDFNLIEGIINKVDNLDEVSNLNKNIGLSLFIQNIKDGTIDKCDKFFNNLPTSLKVDLIINGLNSNNACKTNFDMKNNVDFFRKFIDNEFINEFFNQLKNGNNVKDIFHLKEIVEFLTKQHINEKISISIIDILGNFIQNNPISSYNIEERFKYTILILNNLESKFIDKFKEKLKLIDKDLMCEEIDKLVRRIIFDNDNEKHKYINRILNEFKN